MGGIIRLILMLGVVSYGMYATYQHHNHSSGDTSAVAQAEAAPVHAVPSVALTISPSVSKADGDYARTYINSMMQTAYSWPFGATEQNVSLPSGKTMQLTVNKTRTGWCPIRHEPTYDVDVKFNIH